MFFFICDRQNSLRPNKIPLIHLSTPRIEFRLFEGDRAENDSGFVFTDHHLFYLSAYVNRYLLALLTFVEFVGIAQGLSESTTTYKVQTGALF